MGVCEFLVVFGLGFAFAFGVRFVWDMMCP